MLKINKKRIYIEASSLTEPRTSGIGNTTLNIVRNFAADQDLMREFTLQLIVPFNKVKFLDRYDINSNIVIRKLWLPGKISNILTRLRLMPYMDLFFGKGTYIFPNYKNWPLVRSKSMTYVHDMAHLRHPEFIEPKNLRYLNSHLDEWVRRADKIVTVSQHAKAEFQHYFPAHAHKAITVYNGYDDSLFSQKCKNDAVLRKYGLRTGEYFMFLSNIEPRKNLQNLLSAFKIYNRKHKKHVLLIVGGMGWKNDEILQQIGVMNKGGATVVMPKTFVPDEELPALMCGSIGLVHPALYEGFGIAPLQAMACGKHVIVGSNSSIPEVVGDAGEYVDVQDPRMISEAMEKILQTKSELNIIGIHRAKQFTWELTLAPLKSAVRERSEDI